MKHIRTDWGEVRYTVELTEQERISLASLISLHGVTDDSELLDALRDLRNTHP